MSISLNWIAIFILLTWNDILPICGLVQTPLLLAGDGLACVCNIWREYNLWFLLTPKQPKFVMRMKGNIFFSSPDLKFVLLSRVKQGHTKGIRLPAWREQIRLRCHSCLQCSTHGVKLSVNVSNLCYRRLPTMGTLCCHNQQVLCNSLVHLRPLGSPYAWNCFLATTVSSSSLSLTRVVYITAILHCKPTAPYMVMK